MIGDISKRTLEQFDYTSIAEVAKQYLIVFNASTVDKKSIELIKNDVRNLKALHNFYSRAYTALSIHQFNKINKYLHQWA